MLLHGLLGSELAASDGWRERPRKPGQILARRIKGFSLKHMYFVQIHNPPWRERLSSFIPPCALFTHDVFSSLSEMFGYTHNYLEAATRRAAQVKSWLGSRAYLWFRLTQTSSC